MDQNRCVSCGACVNVCPKLAATIWNGFYSVINENLCVGCGKCVRICPANSIKIKERANEKGLV